MNTLVIDDKKTLLLNYKQIITTGVSAVNPKTKPFVTVHINVLNLRQ